VRIAPVVDDQPRRVVSILSRHADQA
jgi:hypothetical protein